MDLLGGLILISGGLLLVGINTRESEKRNKIYFVTKIAYIITAIVAFAKFILIIM